MDFTRLYAKNFLTLSWASIALDNRGLQLIQGVNEDNTSAASNGAGKSSMVDAICWCLFGTTARGVKGDAVVSRVAKKDCYVTLIMRNGASIYTVTRHRKHATNKNALLLSVGTDTTPAVDLTKGTDAETQKELERVLGCSYEVFMAAIYSGQEAMPDLPGMTDRNLKTLVEEAAGLQRIERAYAIARDRLADAKGAFAGVSDKLQRSGLLRQTAERNRDAAKADHDQLETHRAGLLATLDARLQAEGQALKLAQSRAQAAELPATVAKTRIGEIEDQLTGFRQQQQQAAQLRQAAVQADRQIDRTLLQRCQAAVTEAKNRVDNAALEMTKPCGECGKPHSPEEIDTFVSHAKTVLATREQDLVAARALALQAARVATEAKQVADAAEQALPDVSALTAELTHKRQVVADHTQMLADITEAANKIKGTQADIEHAKTSPNSYDAVIQRHEKEMQQLDEQIAQLTEQVNQALAKVSVQEAVVAAFGPAGVRAQILDTVTPFLNERTAHYLSILSDGNSRAVWNTLTRTAAGELREKFAIEVSDTQGADSFAGLSGGEKRKVRLACALALQDLVASRASQPIRLWVGDEIDDALDAAGLERLMTILEARARERGTVLVISHNDLKDWADEVTTVRKVGGSSVVEGSLCI